VTHPLGLKDLVFAAILSAFPASGLVIPYQRHTQVANHWAGNIFKGRLLQIG